MDTGGGGIGPGKNTIAPGRPNSCEFSYTDAMQLLGPIEAGFAADAFVEFAQ
jgi:hypothetical protein